MAALRFIETLVLLAAAILTILRARPASPPYGRRMARIGLLLALELGVLSAFAMFQVRTEWGTATAHTAGVAFATQGLRALILFAAAGAWFGLIRPEVRGAWPLALGGVCAIALGWGVASFPAPAAIVLVIAMSRMKWIEEVSGRHRAIALLGSAALLVMLSLAPVATVAGGSTRLEIPPAVGVWPPPLLLGHLSSATTAELLLIRPLDRVVQALTDILRIQLLVLPIHLAGTDLKRRFTIIFILVRSIPAVLTALMLAGIAYLGFGYIRLERIRASFEHTLARAETLAAALSEDPGVLRGAPDAARFAAGRRWMGADGNAAQVHFIARGQPAVASPGESLFVGGLLAVGDSLVLVAQRIAPTGSKVEVRVPVDPTYLARIMRPIGGDLVVQVRPNLVVRRYGLRVKTDSSWTSRAVRVAAFDSGGVARHDRRWYLGRSFVPIGDWSRGAGGIQRGAAELDLSTTIPNLLLSLVHSLGGLYAYLGILFAFGLLFSIVEGIAVRSGRSIVQAVVDEAATLRTAAERLGAGDLDYRVPVRGKDEFSVVAASFNQMAANLKRQREELIEAERVEEDLAVARGIQQRFLPQRAPELRELDVAGISIPSREVGGDFYDWFPHADGKLGFTLGDVSGKSVPAALLMSNVLASLRAHDGMRVELAETLGRVNRFIVDQIEPGRFVTLFYAEADPSRETLRYASAGHNPPLVVRADGRLEWLREGGVPLGVLPDVTYSATTIEFAPGDTLIVYSDGITEAQASREEWPDGARDAPPLYGEERLADVARSHRGAAARVLLDALIESVQSFARGAAQADDITIAIVRCVPRADRT